MDEDPNLFFLSTTILDQNPIDAGIVLSTFIVFLLIVCSALISGSEVAFFSIDSKKIKTIKKEEVFYNIKTLLNKPNKLLATILITNNLVNVAIIILSTYITNTIFDFDSLPILKFIIQIVVVTFILLMAGELIPKVLANQNPLKFAKFMTRPLGILNDLFSPLSNLLVSSSSFIEKRSKSRGYNISVDDLSKVLDLAGENVTNSEEKRILRSIVEFGNIQVKEIMKSRIDVTSFSIDSKFKDIKSKIIKSGYSRIPVYRENFDQIEGVLYIKDLLPHLEKDKFEWESIIREPFFVPEGKMIDDLLKEFQLKKIHLAIVVDEYGGTSGIITLEDIIEEIVGEINDEFDDDGLQFSKLDGHNFIFEGKVSLNDALKILDLEFDFFDSIKGESDSLAGLILEIAGTIPKVGEILNFENLTFKIESVDKRRIKRVKISINE
ncbi:MAG: gliding motility-associated protein GldE [Flavobacteriales bacterium]